MSKKSENQFKKEIDRVRGRVIEKLQLGGDCPQCTVASSTMQDWQHILTETVGELFEQLRFDENDPEVQRMILIKLAEIAAITEAWAGKMEGL